MFNLRDNYFFVFITRSIYSLINAFTHQLIKLFYFNFILFSILSNWFFMNFTITINFINYFFQFIKMTKYDLLYIIYFYTISLTLFWRHIYRKLYSSTFLILVMKLVIHYYKSSVKIINYFTHFLLQFWCDKLWVINHHFYMNL